MDSESLLSRFDRLPSWPYGMKLLFVIGMGFFFCFFDIVTIGVALPKITAEYHITKATSLWAITSSLCGYIFGSILLALISDRYGRKFPLCLSIMVFSVGSILTACATDFYWIVIFRFITGMGIGSDISEISTYLSELSPAHLRGRMTSIAVLFGMSGIALVPFVAVLLVPAFSWGYRALFVLGGVGGFFVLILRRHVPESIYWLVTHGRHDEAKRDVDSFERAQSSILDHGKHDGFSHMSNQDRFISSSNTRHSFYLTALLFVSIWFIFYIANYAWLTLSTTFLIEHGLHLAKSLFFVAIDSLGLVFGAFLMVLIGDRVERKFLCSAVSVLWGVILLVFGWFPHVWVLYIAGFLSSSSIGVMIPVLYTYTAESFSTTSRATGVALTDGVGHLGGALCGQIVIGLSQCYFTNRFAGYYTVMSLCCFFVAVLLMFGHRMTCKGFSDIEA